MIHRIAMALCFVVAMLAFIGCNNGQQGDGPPLVGPPIQMQRSAAPAVPAASTPTQAQLTAIRNCQAAITAQGLQFTDRKADKLNQCLSSVLLVQLPFENGLLSSDRYDAALTAARTSCAQSYQQIGQASTAMVNQIVAVCAGVQSLVLPYEGYDPLEFGSLTREQNLSVVADASQLAGRLCGADDLWVDAFFSVQQPRFASLLTILDNGTGQFAISGPASSTFSFTPTIPNIPLDSRGIYPALP